MNVVVWRIPDSTGQLGVRWRFASKGTAQLDDLSAVIAEAMCQDNAYALCSGGAGALQAFHTKRFD